MMQIGWFGVGSGKYADPDAVAEIAEAAEALGYESIWVGEHPVLIDPHEAPSPLPPESELLDPIPVLAYAAAAVPDTLAGAGVQFAPKDLEQAAELLGALAFDDDLRAGILAGQRRRLQDFGDARITRQLETMLAS